MSDTLSFAELEAQHAELLPARTVLSLFSISGSGSSNVGGNGQPAVGTVGVNIGQGINTSHNSGSVVGANGLNSPNGTWR
jgi:hypothetical protein